MLADISEGFLDDAKDSQFEIRGQPAFLTCHHALAMDGWHLLLQIIAQRLKGGRKPQIFQYGRPQRIADPAHITHGLLKQALQFIQPAASQERIQVHLRPAKFHPLHQPNQILHGPIVKLVRKTLAFLFLAEQGLVGILAQAALLFG